MSLIKKHATTEKKVAANRGVKRRERQVEALEEKAALHDVIETK